MEEKYTNISTIEEWENIYNQLIELQYEFTVRHNKRRIDFSSDRAYKENNSEKQKNVNEAVDLIQRHTLYYMLIDEDLELEKESNEPIFEVNELKEYYDGRQMYIPKNFATFSSRLLSKIESKIDFLSKKD